MKVKAWGTRGSLPIFYTQDQSGCEYIGGNTSCYEIIIDDGNHVVIDAGSGFFPLGQDWYKEKHRKDQIDLFFTHFHYDHLNGFMFFDPFFQAKFKTNIFSPFKEMNKVLDQLHHEPYSPIPISAIFEQKPHYTILEGGQYQLSDDVQIFWRLNNHPGDSYSYKIVSKNKSIIIATDIELTENDFKRTQQNCDFFQDADLIIIDGQFNQKEVQTSKKGWGHSSKEDGLRLAALYNIQTIAFTHHDIKSSDKDIYRDFQKLLKLEEEFIEKNNIHATLMKDFDVIDVG